MSLLMPKASHKHTNFLSLVWVHAFFFTVSPDQPDQQLDFCKNMLILNLMPARHFKRVGTGATQVEEMLKKHLFGTFHS